MDVLSGGEKQRMAVRLFTFIHHLRISFVVRGSASSSRSVELNMI